MKIRKRLKCQVARDGEVGHMSVTGDVGFVDLFPTSDTIFGKLRLRIDRHGVELLRFDWGDRELDRKRLAKF